MTTRSISNDDQYDVVEANVSCFRESFCKLADEIEGAVAGKAILDRRFVSFLNTLLMEVQKPVKGEVYWRGVSALYLSTEEHVDVPNPADHSDFIDWAGKHDNVKAIITAALERGTYDVDMLRFIVEESEVHNAVRKGTL